MTQDVSRLELLPTLPETVVQAFVSVSLMGGQGGATRRRATVILHVS